MTLADVNRTELARTTADLKKSNPNVNFLALEMDQSSESSVNAAIRETVKAFDNIDIAVNNAGIAGLPLDTVNTDLLEQQRVLSVNFTGVWLCQKAQITQMLKEK